MKAMNDIREMLCISIHALLAESDRTCAGIICRAPGFLSTLSLRRATSHSNAFLRGVYISIHALLAESDQCFTVVSFA